MRDCFCSVGVLRFVLKIGATSHSARTMAQRAGQSSYEDCEDNTQLRTLRMLRAQNWDNIGMRFLHTFGLSAASFAQEDGRLKQPFTISLCHRDSDYDVSGGALAHPRPL